MKTQYYGYFFDDTWEPRAIVRWQDARAILLKKDGTSINDPISFYRIITGDVGGSFNDITEAEAQAFQKKWNVSFSEKK